MYWCAIFSPSAYKKLLGSAASGDLNVHKFPFIEVAPNPSKIHLWNFCSDQRRLIFMPTAHPSLNAFAMFALGTSCLRLEQSSTCYAANFCRSKGKARLSGRPSLRSRRPAMSNTLEFKLRAGVNVHSSYETGTRICRQRCKPDLIRCDRHEETAQRQWTTMYGKGRYKAIALR